MQIKTEINGDLVYFQKFEDSRTLNNTVAHIMKLPKGSTFKTTVTNNDHDLVLNTGALDFRELQAVANGPKTRVKAGT